MNFIKFLVCFFLISFIFIVSCNNKESVETKKENFNSYFNKIKNSNLLSDGKNIRYYGEVRGIKNVLVFDSLNVHFDEKSDLIFSAVRTNKIDTLKIKELLFLLRDYQKNLNFRGIEINDYLFNIYFDFTYVDKATLPKTEYQKSKDLDSIKNGAIIFNISDSTNAAKEIKFQKMQKISERWYIRLFTD